MSRKASVHSSGGPRTGLNPLASVIRGSLLVSAGVLLAQPGYIDGVQAGPQGGNVVAGQGNIQKPDASTTLIQQQSHSLAINWQTFNVAQHELVQFNQPSASAAVLNRVLNQSPSQIFGQISANGNVFIMNGAGIVFGETARVNVGGLFASSLDITNEDFMAGRYDFFSKDGTNPGAIINKGLITASAGGFVLLAGGSVQNDGVILANLGHVELAAGKKATLDFDGDGLIRFQVDGEILANAEGVDDAVKNSGTIEADGGTVKLSAQTAKDVFTNAVNNEGIIKAGRVDRSGGKVMLAGLGGPVRNTGTVDVSATAQGEDGGTISITSDSVIEQFGTLTADASNGDGGTVTVESNDTTIVAGDSVTSARSQMGKGGTVKLLGERVGLGDNASVDVSGGSGGGTALIGGDYHGENANVRNASQTFVGSGVTLNADAGSDGDGGTVIVWADELTRFFGDVSARGGALSGDGGFVEISGAKSLVYEGSANLSAPNGGFGTLLFDPENIEIVGGSGDGSDDADSSATNLINDAGSNTQGSIVFADEGSGTPDPFIIRESEIEGTDANIVLEARSGVTVSGTFNNDADGGGTEDPGTNVVLIRDGRSLTIRTRNNNTTDTATGIDLTAGGTLNNLQFKTGDNSAGATGAILIESGTAGNNTAAPITVGRLATGATDTSADADTGGITIDAEGAVTIRGNLATGNAISDNADRVSGSISVTSGSSITVADSVTITTGTAQTASNNDSATSGNITFNAGTSIAIGITTTAGALTTGNAIENDDGSISGNISLTAANGGITILTGGTLTTGNAGTAGNTDQNSNSGNVTLSATSGNIALGDDITTGNVFVDNNTATSGSVNITTTTSGSLTGAGAITTGTPTSTSDTSVSGTITLNIVEEVELSAADALKTGSNAGGGTQTSGNIVISAQTIRSNTTNGQLDVSLGSAGGGTNGTLRLTTTGSGGGNDGGIFVTSGETLRLHTIDTDNATAQIVNISQTAGTFTVSNLTVEDVDGDTVTFDAGANSLVFNDTAFDIAAGSLTFIGDEIDLDGGDNSITGAGGTITLQQGSTGQEVGVGGTDTGLGTRLDLTSGGGEDLNAIADGFNSITIGRADSTVQARVNAVTFNDSVTIQSGDSLNGTGGTVLVAGALATANDEGASITLEAGTTVTINSTVTTGTETQTDLTGTDEQPTSGSVTVLAGTDVSGSGSITTGAADLQGAAQTAATTDFAQSGNITITAGDGMTSGGIGLSNGTNALIIGTAQRSGGGAGTDTATTGDITLSSIGEINNGTASTAMNIQIGAATGAGANNTGDVSATTTGSTGNVFLTSASALNLGGITTAGGSAQTVTVSTTGGVNLTVVDDTEDVTGDTVTLDAAAGTLIVQDTAYGIGGGTLTLTADEIDLDGGDNSISGSGTITLQPSTVGTNIGVGGADGGVGLDLTGGTGEDLDALANGFTDIFIGRTDSEGAITVNAHTFDDNITIRSPAGAGSITVSGALATTAVGSSPSPDIDLISATSIAVNAAISTGASPNLNTAGDDAAVSGSIMLTAGTTITGSAAGTITTGDATVDAAGGDAGGGDSATSGSIVLDADGAIQLAATSGGSGDALRTGDATVSNDDGNDSATSGSITINDAGASGGEADKISSDGATGQVDVRLGTASGATTNTNGSFSATTDGGGGAAGGVFVSSDDSAVTFTVSGITTGGIADQAGGDVDIDTATDSALIVTGAVDTSGGAATGAGQNGGNVSLTGGNALTVSSINTAGSDAATGDGGDTGNVALALTSGFVTINAGTISLTGGDAATGGDVEGDGGTFSVGNAVLNGAVIIDTRKGAVGSGAGADGAVSFTGTLNGNGAGVRDDTLTIDGSGTTTFTGIVGGTDVLGNVVIENTTTVNVDAAFTVNSLTATTGIGTFDATGAAITTTGADDAAGGNVSVTADTAIIVDAVTALGGAAATAGSTGNAGGTVTLSATGTGTLTVNGTIDASGSTGNATGGSDTVGGAGGSVILSTADAALSVSAITASGGDAGDVGGAGANGGVGGTISLTAGGAGRDLTLNGLLDAAGGDPATNGGTDGAGGTVTLVAGRDILDGLNDATLKVDAGALAATAGRAVGESADKIETDITTLTATAAGTGGIFINELDTSTQDGLAIGAAGLHTAGSATGEIDITVSVVGGGTNGFSDGGNAIETQGTDVAGGDITVAVTGTNAGITLTGTPTASGSGNSGVGSGFNGGNITLTAADGAIAVAALTTTGGAANTTGTGGTGGAIDIRVLNADGGATRDITASGALTTSGGAGAGAGQAGGSAGTVNVQVLDGDTDADGSVAINGIIATGGNAGDGTGVEGSGGTVTLEADGGASAGNVTINSAVNALKGATGTGGGANGNINVTADGGSVVDGNAGGQDFQGGSLTVVSDTGFGSAADPIETTVDTLDINNTTSGDAVIVETDAVTVGGTNGITTNGGAISLTAGGTITVSQAITTTSGGQVDLDANGASSSITVNDAITSPGSAINVTADDDVSIGAAGSITSTGAGNVTVTADADGGAGGTDGALAMTAGSSINSGTGSISLGADENITITSATTGAVGSPFTAVSTSGSINETTDDAADNIIITGSGNVSLTGATGVGSGTTTGLDLAGVTSLVIDTNQSIDVNTDSFISTLFLTVDPATTADTYTVVDNDGGVANLTFNVADSGAFVTVNEVEVAAGSLNFSLTTDSGNIVLGEDTVPAVGGGANTSGGIFTNSGSVTLNAGAAILDGTTPVSEDSPDTGSLNFAANIATTGAVSLTTQGGDIGAAGTSGDIDIQGTNNITVNASTGNAFIATDQELSSLTLSFDPQNDVVSFSLSGGTNVSIGEDGFNNLLINRISNTSVQLDVDITSTTNNLIVDDVSASTGIFNLFGGDVTLTATAGSIFGNDTGDGTPAVQTTGGLTLVADTGITGSTGGPPSASGSLDTDVGSLQVTNNTSGNVDIANINNVSSAPLTINGVTNPGGGTTTISNAGALTVAGDIVQAGSITLDALETVGSNEDTDDLTVNSTADIRSTAGNVILRAGDDIILAGGGSNSIDTVGGTGTVLLSANFNNDPAFDVVGNNGFISIGDTVTVDARNTTSGALVLQADDLIITGSPDIRAGGVGGGINLFTESASVAMQIGGAGVAGTFSVSDAELARFTTFDALTFGSNLTQTIDVVTALIPAAGGTVTFDADGVGGSVVLDDEGGGTAALRSNGNPLVINSTGNIAAAGGDNAATAEIDSNTATVTLNTGGSIGTGTADRLAFSANTGTVTITTATGGVFLEGLGDLTLGAVTTVSGDFDVIVPNDSTITLGSGATNTNIGGVGNIVLTGDEIDLTAGGTVSGTGSLTLQPLQATEAIAIAGAAGTGDTDGTLNLTTTELGTLANGFSSLVIGRSDGQHVITIGAVSPDDPTTVRSPVAGGSIDINGDITATDDASLTLTSVGTITVNTALISTEGDTVSINGPVTLGATPNTVTIDTTAGGNTGGAAITFSSAINDNAAGDTALVLVAGDNTGNPSSLSLPAIGTTTAIGGLTVTTGDTLTLNADVRTDAGNVDFTGAADVNLATAATITIDTDFTADASAAGDILFAAAGTLDGTTSQALVLDARSEDDGGNRDGGAVTLSAVGTGTRLTSLTVRNNGVNAGSAGATTLNGNILTNGGNADFQNAPDVNLAAGATITIDTDVDTAGTAGSVFFTDATNSFGAQLDGAATGDESLTIDVTSATDGNVRLGRIGNAQELGALSVTADTGVISLFGDIDTSRNGAIGTGNVTFGSVVELTRDTVVTTDGGTFDVSAAEVVSDSNGPWNLTVTTTDGTGGTGGNIVLGLFNNNGGASSRTFVSSVILDASDTTGGDLILGNSLSLDTHGAGGGGAAPADFTFDGDDVRVDATLFIDTEQGGTSDGGDINLHQSGLAGSVIDGNSGDLGLTLNASGATNGGVITLGLVSNTGLGGNFLGTLSATTNGTGVINLGNNILVNHSTGAGGITLAGNVDVLNAGTLTLDGDGDSAGNASAVNLGNANIAASNANTDLNIDLSTPSGNGNTITLGSFNTFTGAANRIRNLNTNNDGTVDGDVNAPQAVQVDGAIDINNSATVDIDANMTAGTSLTIENVGTEIDLASGVELTASGGNLDLDNTVAQIDLSGAGGINRLIASAEVQAAATSGIIDSGTPAELEIGAGTNVVLSSVTLNGAAAVLLDIDVDTGANGAAQSLTAGALTAGQITVNGQNSDDNFNFNGQVTAANTSLLIDTVNRVDFADGVGASAGTTLTIQNVATEIELGTGSNLTAGGGLLDLDNSVASIDLAAGAAGTNILTSVGGSVEAAATSGITVSSASQTNLTITSDDGVTLNTVNLNVGANPLLDIDIDQNTGGAALTSNALTAGTVSVNGTGTDDTLTFNGTVTSNSGAVTVADASQIDFQNVSAAAAFSATGTTIDLNNTSYTAGQGVTFTGAVNLDAGGTIVVTSGGGQDITFTSTVADPNAADSLTLTSAGNIVLSNNTVVQGTATFDANGGTLTIPAGFALSAPTVDLSAQNGITDAATTGQFALSGATTIDADVTISGDLFLIDTVPNGTGTVTVNSLTSNGGVGNDIDFDLTAAAPTGTEVLDIAGAGSGVDSNGGNININNAVDSGGITLNAAVTSQGTGTGGTLIVGGGVTVNVSPVAADGTTVNIDGGGVDLVITADIISTGDITLALPRDIIVQAIVNSTGGNISLTADSDNDGQGGLLVDDDNNAGQVVTVDSDTGSVSLSGSSFTNLGGTGGFGGDVGDSVIIKADAAGADADGTTQIAAATTVTLASNAGAAASGNNEDIIIEGEIAGGSGLISVNADGATQLATNILTAGGGVTFADNVSLTGASTVSNGGGAGGITFQGTVDGGNTLSVTGGTGNVAFQQDVGVGTPLSSFTIVSANQATVFDVVTTGAITVTAGSIGLGDQTISSSGGAVSLTGQVDLDQPGGTTTITSGGGANGVTITGAVEDDADGDTQLIIDGNEGAGPAGPVSVTGAIGATNRPASVTIQDATTVGVNDIRSTGAISVTGTAINLNGTTYNGGGLVSFTGPVDLSVAGAGPISVTGAAGAGVAFSSTIDDTGNDTALSVTATGLTPTFGGAIGGTQAIGGLTVTAGAASLPAVTTTGAQNYDAVGNLTLNGSLLVNTAGSGISADTAVTLAAGSGTITLTGSNAANDVTLGTVSGGGQTLNITAAGGDVIFTGAAGTGGSALNGFTVNSNNITLNNGGNASGTATLNATGTLIETAGTLTAPTVNLDAGGGISNGGAGQFAIASTAIDADVTGGNLLLTNAQAAATTISSLTNSVAAGTVDYDQTGGGSVNITGGVTSNNGDIAINADGGGLTVGAAVNSGGGAGGTLTIGGGVTLNVAPTVGGGNITLDGGGQDIVITAALSASNAIALTAPRDIIIQNTVSTTGGFDITLTADSDLNASGGVLVDTGGFVDATGNVVLTGSTFTNLGGAGAFGTDVGDAINVKAGGGTDIEADGNITLQTSAAGGLAGTEDIVIEGLVTSTGAGTVSVDANDLIELATTVTTTGGTVTFADNVLLTGASVVNNGAGAGSASFQGTVNGAQTLSVTSGATTFSGAVGNTAPLTSLTVTGNTASLQAATTTGAQNYSGVTTTTLNGTLTVNTAGSGVTAGNVLLGAGGGTITLTGSNAANDVTLGTVTGTQALNITANGGDIVLGAVSGPVASMTTTSNTADLQSIASTGAIAVTAGNIDLNGASYQSTGAGITLTGAVDLDGAGVQSLNAGGAILVTGAVADAGNDTNLTIANSTGTTFQNAVTANALTISNSTGTVAIQGNLTVTTLSPGAAGYNLSLTGATTSVTNDTNFLNTGTVTLGDGGDTLTFAGGLSTIAASATNINGTVQTNGQQIDLGPAILQGNSIVSSNNTVATGANINLSTVNAAAAGGQSLTLNAGTAGNINFNGAVGATALSSLTANGNNIALNAAATATTTATLNAGGALSQTAGVLTAPTVNLDAGNGITGVSALTIPNAAPVADAFSISATTITADNTNAANVHLLNGQTSATTVNSITTVGGNVIFEQNNGGAGTTGVVTIPGAGVVSSGGGDIDMKVTGGNSAIDNLIVVTGAAINTQPGAGGVATIKGGVNVQNLASIQVGAGDITLDGGSLDLVVSSPLSAAVAPGINLQAERDIIIRNSLTTTNGVAINITADDPLLGGTGGDGVGGVILENAGSISGSGTVNITGGTVFADPSITTVTQAAGSGIYVQGDISSTGAGNITINSTTNAPTVLDGTTITNASGSVVLSDATQVSTDSTIITDAMTLGGAVTSTGGNLTILPFTNGADLDIGAGPLLTGGNLTQLSGFTGTLNIGGDAAAGTDPRYAGNLTVTGALDTIGDLTLVSLGDILIDNAAGGSVSSDGTLSLIALGADAATLAGAGITVPAGFTNNGGTLLDTDANVGNVSVNADTLAILAPGAVGSDTGGGSVVVNVTNQTEVATGAQETFIDSQTGSPVKAFTSAGADPTILVVPGIVAAYGTTGVGLFDQSLLVLSSNRISGRAGLQTETGELGFIDVGLFLLPDAFAVSSPGVLVAALWDPEFPGDLRPEDPDDEEEWERFFEEIVREFVASRYPPLPEDASDEAKRERERKITAEMSDIIAYYNLVRARERAVIAFEEAQQQRLEGGGEPPAAEPPPGEPPAAEPEPAASIQEILPGDGSPSTERIVTGYGPSGYVGQTWAEGGIGIEAAWWPKLESPWPKDAG